ncbi:FGGY family carbohydrate kinase, partial [Albidovulum sp.]
MFLGLDIGTSAVKAVLSDGGAVAHSASAPLRLSSPRDGWSEQAPGDWWRAVCAALAELAERAALDRVEAVGLSGQMHGAVLLDRHGEVIRPAILWNDSRAAADCETLRQRLPRIGEIAGVLPLPGFTAPKLMWLRRMEPEAHAAIRHVLLPKDYIGLRLHGGLVTDRSDAAGTLWLDQRRRAWSREAAEASDTDPAWLPELRDGDALAGRIGAAAAAATGLRAGLPVFA